MRVRSFLGRPFLARGLIKVLGRQGLAERRPVNCQDLLRRARTTREADLVRLIRPDGERKVLDPVQAQNVFPQFNQEILQKQNKFVLRRRAVIIRRQQQDRALNYLRMIWAVTVC